MMLKWLDAREAAEVGVALADQFSLTPGGSGSSGKSGSKRQRQSPLEELLRGADRDVRGLHLNFYQKARFANSFKWRLIERGVERSEADAVTQSLILHLSQVPVDSASGMALADGHEPIRPEAQALLARAREAVSAEDWSRAAESFEEFASQYPDRSDILNSLGVTLYKLGRYSEAEQRFREAIEVDPVCVDALYHLASLVQANPTAAEILLRRVLKINPKYPGARSMLGLMLVSSGRDHDAKLALRKALKVSSSDINAVMGLAHIARSEGRFDEASTLLKRALQLRPRLPNAWAALATDRRMTSAEADWLREADEIVASGIDPWEEAELRFAMGKYCDDVRDYDRAFEHYQRANQLLKATGGNYDLQGHRRFADDMIKVHSARAITSQDEGGSDSDKPTFVLGMPRSGTSLVEQIIASHPAAEGAGELDYWLQAARAHHDEIRRGILPLSTRKRLAEDYLRHIERRYPKARRIVDKSTANSDYVGFIFSVFPNARIIRMRRDPIDTCLSCYFQRFSTAMRFTMDLADLADYYKIHQRLMSHWRGVLPPRTLLEVQYEDLVADLEGWTRKILEFIGLEWDARCLSFHETKRSVSTASVWQVRQKLYTGSVQRWRHYEKHLGPLKDLKD
jgi:tetratricopeptide (TPR) repeat protein